MEEALIFTLRSSEFNKEEMRGKKNNQLKSKYVPSRGAKFHKKAKAGRRDQICFRSGTQDLLTGNMG